MTKLIRTNFSSSAIESIQRNLLRFSKFFLDQSNSYDKFLSIGIILCMIPPLLSQILAHSSSEFMKFDSPDFVARWGITEWLISYDGGFVRRGITGEIVQFISKSLFITPNIVIVIITILLLLLLYIWIIKISGKIYPIYIIFSPLLLGGPIFSGIVMRKDVLVSLVFMCSLSIITSNQKMVIKIIFLNILLSFIILSHEIFIFIGVPFVLLYFIFYKYKKINYIYSILISTVPFLLIILIGLNRGNLEIGMTLVENWNIMNMQIDPSYCCFEKPVAAFHGIANADWALNRNFHHWTLVIHGFILNPVLWLVMWIICGLIVSKFIQQYNSGKEAMFLKCYIIQTIFALPLFLIGWDYGRWILLLIFTSFFITIASEDFLKTPRLDKFLNSLIWFKPLYLWQKILFTFFFGVPHIWKHVDYQLNVMPILDFIYNLNTN